MTPLISVITIAAAIAGPLTTYLIAVRRFSGKIGSSDASDLWGESRSIREWSATQIKLLTDEVARLEKRVAHVEARNTSLADDNASLRMKLGRLMEDLRQCRARVAELEGASHG